MAADGKMTSSIMRKYKSIEKVKEKIMSHRQMTGNNDKSVLQKKGDNHNISGFVNVRQDEFSGVIAKKVEWNKN